MSDSSGKIVAFEQDGDLCLMHCPEAERSQGFSFRKEEDNDSRHVRNEHDIKIIRG